MLGLFLDTLTTDEKYSLLNREAIYCNIFRCNYLTNEKLFLNFFFFSLDFRNLDLILNIFKKKLKLVADVFSNLGTPKNVVR